MLVYHNPVCSKSRGALEILGEQGADVEVDGAGGHFTIGVTSEVFAGKGLLESQRLVYGAIAHLMKGDRAPVHAVDSLKTRAR
jgi:acid stress-induced BolA-like protein IbaG/YrbA